MEAEFEQQVPNEVPSEFCATYAGILSTALKYGVMVKVYEWDLIPLGQYVIIFSGAGYHISRGIVKCWNVVRDYCNPANPTDGDIKIDYVLDAGSYISSGSLFPNSRWYSKDSLIVAIASIDSIEVFRSKMCKHLRTKEW